MDNQPNAFGNSQEYPLGWGDSSGDSIVRLTNAQVCDFCQLWLKSVNDTERLVSQPASCHELRSTRESKGSCILCHFIAHTAVGRHDFVPWVRPWGGKALKRCLQDASWRNGDWLNLSFLFADTSWTHPRGSLWVGFQHDPRWDPISPGGCIQWESRAQTAMDWIKDCCESHQTCRITRLRGNLPARLLRVHRDRPGARTLAVQLVHTATLKEGTRYSALSHCWGRSGLPGSSKTTLATLQEFQRGIRFEGLSKNFQDAALVTSTLGLEYLWVDALCIIQDSKRDWETESAKMGSIYANAYVTIAADGAKDSNGGLFLDLATEEAYSLSGHRIALRLGHAHRSEVSASGLSKRGWVLQEMILSPRVLHFSRGRMYWQCAASNLLSEDGTLDRRITSDSSENANSAADAPYPPRLRLNGKQSFDTWWEWVHEYTKRDLKVPTDRLAAIAGITRYFEQIVGATPLVGLWRENLHRHILWSSATNNLSGTPAKSVRRLDMLGIPSWSWISACGMIENHGADHRWTWDVIFKQCTVKWSKNELTSAISTAEIHGAGKMTRIRLQERPRSSPGYPYGNYLCYEHGNAYIESGRVWLDEPQPLPEFVYCLLIGTDPNSGSEKVLILKRCWKILPGKPRYQRLAVAEILYRDSPESQDENTAVRGLKGNGQATLQDMHRSIFGAAPKEFILI